MPIYENYTTATTGLWDTWIRDQTGSTTVTNNVWYTWTTSTSATSATTWNITPQYPTQVRVAETEEELAARAERDEQRRIMAAEAAERREARRLVEAAAETQAADTLRLLLNGDQWEQWEAENRFVVTVESGNRYEIRRGVSGNVRLLDDAAATREALCAHPNQSVYDDEGGYQGTMPIADIVIAQVLALTTDEESFRRIANITDARSHRLTSPSGSPAHSPARPPVVDEALAA